MPACFSQTAPLTTHPTVCSADTDVSYAVKPVWDSYLEYMYRNEVDGAWQAEMPRKPH